MKITISPKSKLFPGFATRIEKEIKDNVTMHNVLLFLSGGSCIKAYPYLAESILRLFRNSEDDDIQNLTILQVDERFQPKKKEDSNAYQMEKAGLWKTCQKANLEYYTVSQERSLGDSVEFYNDTMKKFNISRMPQFDKEGTQRKKKMYQIGVFGIGEDGHTAGLLRGYESYWNTESFYVGYENSGQFKNRITLTPCSIKKMDMIFVLVQGDKKKKVLKKLNHLTMKQCSNEDEKELENKFPAVVLSDIPQVEIFTDQKIS